MDITIGNRSEQTGRFNFVRGTDGDVSFDDTEAHAVVTSAVERRGLYWFDDKHGSRLRDLKSLTRLTPSQAESAVLEAEAPLEAAGSIKGLTARAETDISTGLGRLKVRIRWTTPSGLAGDETVGG